MGSKREQKPEQHPAERRNNFNEVSHGYTPEQAVREARRCLACKRPLCVEGCPLGIDIPGFISCIIGNKLQEAFEVIRRSNMFPAICGRVCPQENQCEGSCILGKRNEPVAIGNLERFVADHARSTGYESTVEQAPSKGKSVAIAGSGPSGLACAYELSLLGYTVTIFEALHEAGGVLTYGIPEFRLPKVIVRHEIEQLAQRGVKIITNTVVGKTVTIDELIREQGYSAVYVASGAGVPVFLNIPGEDLNGIYSANEFLTRVNLMKAYRFPEFDTPIYTGKRVAVIGGGNTAMDSARAALRLGAEDVCIIYRRSEEEFPARVEEVAHAKEEGIRFMLLSTPVRYLADSKGLVSGVVVQKMELGEPDSSGRRKPVPTDTFTEEAVDTVIVAIGTRPNPIITGSDNEIETNRWGYIVVGQRGETRKQGVFAGGDIVSGAATVIQAMGAGKAAAHAIDDYIS